MHDRLNILCDLLIVISQYIRTLLPPSECPWEKLSATVAINPDGKHGMDGRERQSRSEEVLTGDGAAS